MTVTKLALIRLADSAVLQTVPVGAGFIDLPEGAGRLTPPLAGWEGGGALTYGEGGQASVGPARYRLGAVTDFVVPDGSVTVGEPVYTIADDGVTETYAVQDAPPPPTPPTITELLAASGYSLADLKAALDAAP